MIKENYTVVFVSMEMVIPELQEPACGANFRGGLGILAGDIMEGLAKRGIKAFGIVPFNQLHWMTGERIFYNQSSAQYLFEAEINGKTIKAWKINRGGSDVLGIELGEIFDVLYTADRWKRLNQEILLGKAVPVLLRKLNIKPDILWLQEGHTARTFPAIDEDPYFEGVKILFTTHTPLPEGLEKFYGDRFNELELNHNKYHPIFVKDGLIDMTGALMKRADKVTAVSREHSRVTKKMFPEFAHKVVGIRNGSSRELWLSPRQKQINTSTDLLKLWEVDEADKQEFIEFINNGLAKRGIQEFNPRKLLMAWVRRMAWYKQQYPMLVPVIRAICAERGESVTTPLGKLEGLGIQVFSAGRAHESDNQCLGWMSEFERWMREPCLRGKFVFLPEYNLKLLQLAARGCDIWFTCPLPGWEACGTGDQRATINRKANLTTKTGGALEYIREFDPITGKGNGFFIDPYEPKTVYEKLKIISDLYYAWIENGDDRWLKLKMNTFRAGKLLDVVCMIKKYQRLFEDLLNSGEN